MSYLLQSHIVKVRPGVLCIQNMKASFRHREKTDSSSQPPKQHWLHANKKQGN